MDDLIKQFDKLKVNVKYDCVWVTMGYLNNDSAPGFDQRMPVNRPRPGGVGMSEPEIEQMLAVLKGNRNVEGFFQVQKITSGLEENVNAFAEARGVDKVGVAYLRPPDQDGKADGHCVVYEWIPAARLSMKSVQPMFAMSSRDKSKRTTLEALKFVRHGQQTEGRWAFTDYQDDKAGMEALQEDPKTNYQSALLFAILPSGNAAKKRGPLAKDKAEASRLGNDTFKDRLQQKHRDEYQSGVKERRAQEVAKRRGIDSSMDVDSEDDNDAQTVPPPQGGQRLDATTLATQTASHIIGQAFAATPPQ